MNLIPTQRHLFDIPLDIAYFNCAYYSPQLNDSRLRLVNGVKEKSHPWERTQSGFFEDAEIIRQLSSEIFGGDPGGFAINPAASYGLSTAARAIEPHLKTGDRILLIAEEFPSNVLIWRRISHETGAEIITVPTPVDGNWTKAIIEKLNKEIKLVAISSCHWTDGAYIDLMTIGKACQETGCIFVVDATQSLGAMPLSIDEIKPDFLVAACYKWMLCPYGFSLLYVSEKWRDSRPLEESWQARENAEDFAGLVKYSDKYMPGSRRFDVGEKCRSTILPGVIAAFEQVKKWGVPEIANSLSAINMQISSQLEQLGFKLPDDSQRSPHMFGALLPEHYKGNLVSELKARNIYISQRGNSLRFAPHLHINDNDLNRLLGTLKELIN
jgi:selenocysteine lyase/cysteine desulfurase